MSQLKQDLWNYVLGYPIDDRVAAELRMKDRVVKHGLGVLFREHLRRADPDNFYRSALRVEFQRYLNAAFEHEIGVLFSIAKQRGIKLVYCKGFLLSDMYDTPEERIFSDIDLLVSNEQLPPMLEVLGALGYIHTASGKPVTPELATLVGASPMLIELGEMVRPIQHVHSRIKIRLDLHVSLFIKEVQRGLTDAHQMIDHAVQGDIAGHQVWLLEIHDQLIHLLVHYCIHHTYVGFVRTLQGRQYYSEINRLFEIALFLEKYNSRIDWNTFIAYTLSYQVPQEVLFTLRLIDRIFPSRVPVDILSTLHTLSESFTHDQLNAVMPLQQFLPLLLQTDPDLIIYADILELVQHILPVSQYHFINTSSSSIGSLTTTESWNVTDRNATQRTYMLNKPLYCFIEEQVARTPHASAVVFEGTQLTYSELNGRAATLAQVLQSAGVQSNSIVGVCIHRSIDLVIALLGILKAGGAYLPLDPEYPIERLRFMIEDSGSSVVLTQHDLASILPATNTPLICIDANWTHTSSVDSNSCQPFSPDNLAYVMYTSGSTGRPKGVLCHHRGIVNRLLWMQETYQLTSRDRVLQKTPYSFDVSVWEFFWPLMTGATLVVARPGGHRDSSYLVDIIQREHITTLHFVPPMLGVFLDDPGVAACTSLRHIFCSGEALSYELQEWCFATFGDHIALHNLYGPTEASVDVSYCPCQPSDPRKLVPIGYPVANTQLYILDNQLRPVPQGTSGELYIGGVQVAHGYVQRPGLTAERFLPDPFSTNPGARLYKTSDIVRCLPDGAIVYLGRDDHQVKMRGVRIELGEIEAVLRQYHKIRDAIVQVWEPLPEQKHLIAYIELHASTAPTDKNPDSQRHTAMHIASWEELYNEVYSQPCTSNPDRNLAGWHSSYTGQPFPEVEMLDWIEHTIARILYWHPRRVLEIGCGTGLLLFRLAPYCERYHGVDISQVALHWVAQHLNSAHIGNCTIQLTHGNADEPSLFNEELYDTIILNSVIQLFPDSTYLRKVLEKAVESLRDGGTIFIGDVRCLALLAAFHTSVELYQASDDLLIEQLKQHVQKKVSKENELLIDPAFFEALSHDMPRISHVDVQIKTNKYSNELSCFRYDVVLKVGPCHTVIPETWQDWNQHPLNRSELVSQLSDVKTTTLALQNVMNGRLQPIFATTTLLHNDAIASTPVGVLKKQVLQDELNIGLMPNELHDLGSFFNYHVAVRWSSSGNPYLMDVVFIRHTITPTPPFVIAPPPSAVQRLSVRAHHVNQPYPISADIAMSLAQELRSYMQSHVPDFMIPVQFITLDQFPRLLNGKTDRAALPPPDVTTNPDRSSYEPPANAIEQALATLWSQILGIHPISRYDHFFHLGGDSLSCMRVVAEARRRGLHFTPTQVFQHPVLAEFAANLGVYAPVSAEQGLVTGDVILTPNQHISFNTYDPDRHLWVIGDVWDVPPTVKPDHLCLAVEALLQHHDALRLRSEESTNGWRQWIDPPAKEIPFVSVDLGNSSAAEQRSLMESMATTFLASLRVTTGPLIRVVYFGLGATTHGRLLFIVHHMVCDSISRRLLSADFFRAYQCMRCGEVIQLPPKTSSLRFYSQQLYEYAQSDALRQEVPYWTSMARQSVPHLYRDTSVGIPRGSTLRTISRHLDGTTSRSLLIATEREGLKISDVLLAALVDAWAPFNTTRQLLVDVEFHGRETPFPQVDLSRTVGWISYPTPVLLNAHNQVKGWPTIHHLVKQWRNIPNYGLGYGLLRYVCADAEVRNKIAAMPAPEIQFNFLGHRSTPQNSEAFAFTPARERFQIPTSSQVITRHTVMVNAKIASDQIEVVWTYSSAVHTEATITAVLDQYTTLLSELALPA